LFVTIRISFVTPNQYFRLYFGYALAVPLPLLLVLGVFELITRRQFLETGILSLLAVQVSDLTEPGGAGMEPKDLGGDISQVISSRRTVRRYSEKGLTREQLMAILWAAQGVSEKRQGLRTAPSAGALYPLEVFAFTGQGTVKGLSPGVYRFVPRSGNLEQTMNDDTRKELASVCLSQTWIAQAPVCLVISAVYERTMQKYGERGVRYADIESGCAAQNVFLMAGAMRLSTGIVGAFRDERVRKLTGAREDTRPLLVMPVGYGA